MAIEGTIIIVGDPEDLSESLVAAMDNIVAGRDLMLQGLKNLKEEHSILKMLHMLGHLQETKSERSIDLCVTRKYFKHLNNVLLSHTPTKNNITVYTEKDGGFELWGYL